MRCNSRALNFGVCRYVIAVLLCLPAIGYAQKTDIILLKNGDRITGDIKEFQRGIVRVTTDTMGTVFIEWEEIQSIHTDKTYTVETQSGLREFGSIQASPDSDGLVVTYNNKSVVLDAENIVTLRRVKDNFWRRLEGNIGVGLSAKKANHELNINIFGDAKYQTRKHVYRADFYSTFSNRNDADENERHNLAFSHSAFIVPKWFSLAGAELERNTELNLHLRTLVTGGASYEIIKSNRHRLITSFGLAANNENYFFGGADRLSGEAFVSLSYDYFKFSTPKADVVTSLAVYPSLTEANRVRTTFDTTVSWEMVKDFWWDVSLYYTADNKPPEDERNNNDKAPGTDWGLNTGIKWKY